MEFQNLLNLTADLSAFFLSSSASAALKSAPLMLIKGKFEVQITETQKRFVPGTCRIE